MLHSSAGSFSAANCLCSKVFRRGCLSFSLDEFVILEIFFCINCLFCNFCLYLICLNSIPRGCRSASPGHFTGRKIMNDLYQCILDAHRALRPQVAVTPLNHSPALSALTGCEVYLKCEHLQHTGSFKFRGASNKIRLLDAMSRRTGVATVSSGNHGLGWAWRWPASWPACRLRCTPRPRRPR
ncbi:pyridoxal-phosphate dependent enzyme [Chromobacterium amazonense]|uniref:pyridoxal-phosphate dependent enzyme n=1 Tax=Chromobacterium amazonense TaxID=1382803 RepID=UPI0036F1C5CF